MLVKPENTAARGGPAPFTRLALSAAEAVREGREIDAAVAEACGLYRAAVLDADLPRQLASSAPSLAGLAGLVEGAGAPRREAVAFALRVDLPAGRAMASAFPALAAVLPAGVPLGLDMARAACASLVAERLPDGKGLRRSSASPSAGLWARLCDLAGVTASPPRAERALAAAALARAAGDSVAAWRGTPESVLSHEAVLERAFRVTEAVEWELDGPAADLRLQVMAAIAGDRRPQVRRAWV